MHANEPFVPIGRSQVPSTDPMPFDQAAYSIDCLAPLAPADIDVSLVEPGLVNVLAFKAYE
jgi:hypothetical protein